MQGLKSAILAIFLNGPGWPCPVSAAIKNPSRIKKIFLFWVPMNTKKDWKAKLERPHFFKVQSGKITVWSASWSARLVCRIKLADKLQKFSSFRDFGLAFGCILNGLCELSDKLDSSLIANIALLHMYPVTCIDVIESAAVSSLCSSHDSVCVRYFEFWCYYLFSRRKTKNGMNSTIVK